MKINHLILIGLFLIALFATVQFSDAQYSGNPKPSSIDWRALSENATQKYLEMELLQGEDVFEETIKTRISGSGEDVFPPFYHVRIIYDILSDGEIETKDVVFNVKFLAPTFSHAELELKYTIDYMAPHRALKYFNEELPFIPHVTGKYLNIMCKMGFEKVYHEAYSQPICVKPESVKKLIERNFIEPNVDVSELSHWNFEPRSVGYRIDGATIQNMTIKEKNHLIIDIDSQEKGELLISLPRYLIDSRLGYCNHIENGTPDDFFFILVEGQGVDYFERWSHQNNRFLVIEFDNNSTQIEIIGSCIP